MTKGLNFLYSNENAKTIKDNQPFDIIETPSPQFNWALCGGIPLGYVIRFMGQPSSGKTLQAVLVAAEFQKKYPDGIVIFADFEHSFQKEWIEQLGVNTDVNKFVLYANPFNSGVDFFDWLYEDVFPGLIESDKRALIIVDSVDSMVPAKEEGRGAGEYEMSAMASFLPKVLRRSLGQLKESGSTMIFVNQVRANPGQLYGNPEGTSGGNALKHASVLDVHFAAVLKKDEYIFDAAKQRIGHKVRFKVPKNKIAFPYRSGTYKIIYDKGIVEKNVEMAELAKSLNIIERPNNRRYVLEDVTYDGFDRFSDALKDEELFKIIEKRCKDYANNQHKKVKADK